MSSRTIEVKLRKVSIIMFEPKGKKTRGIISKKIEIQEQVVSQREEVRNVGIWIDYNLRFTKHVNQLS